MHAAWRKIVTEFFPTSEYHPTYEMDIEAYTQGDMDAPDYRSEIWDDIVDMIGEFVLEKQELISAHIMSTERFNTTQDYSFLSNVLAEGKVLV